MIYFSIFYVHFSSLDFITLTVFGEGYEAPHAVFSILLLLPLSYDQIFSTALYSGTPECVFFLWGGGGGGFETKFHTHTEVTYKISFVYFNLPNS
jgi:hypothetical protein